MLMTFTLNSKQISEETISQIENLCNGVFQKAVLKGNVIVVTFWTKRF